MIPKTCYKTNVEGKNVGELAKEILSSSAHNLRLEDTLEYRKNKLGINKISFKMVLSGPSQGYKDCGLCNFGGEISLNAFYARRIALNSTTDSIERMLTWTYETAMWKLEERGEKEKSGNIMASAYLGSDYFVLTKEGDHVKALMLEGALIKKAKRGDPDESTETQEPEQQYLEHYNEDGLKPAYLYIGYHHLPMSIQMEEDGKASIDTTKLSSAVSLIEDVALWVWCKYSTEVR